MFNYEVFKELKSSILLGLIEGAVFLLAGSGILCIVSSSSHFIGGIVPYFFFSALCFITLREKVLIPLSLGKVIETTVGWSNTVRYSPEYNKYYCRTIYAVQEVTHIGEAPVDRMVKVFFFEQNLRFTFDPTVYFINPRKPTEEEVELWKMEFYNCPFERISEYTKKKY